MATNRTPPHQRIARAEKAREEWKMKAVERRVENEKLKEDLKYKNMKLKNANSEIRDLKKKIDLYEKKISDQEKLVEKLKKKSK